ncbi:MAG: hypothetical protein O7E54_13485 [Planctomycetota bacterium]|nr:hypothetical protein [Planctomycetota bacterium]
MSDRDRAEALVIEARALLDNGDPLAARPLLDEAHDRFHRLGDRVGLAEAMALLERCPTPPPTTPPTG